MQKGNKQPIGGFLDDDFTSEDELDKLFSCTTPPLLPQNELDNLPKAEHEQNSKECRLELSATILKPFLVLYTGVRKLFSTSKQSKQSNLLEDPVNNYQTVDTQSKMRHDQT